MKIFLVGVFCAFAVIPAALADVLPLSIRQQFYEIDKKAALDEFGEVQKSTCVQAFHHRYGQLFHEDGDLTFSDRVSEMVYDQLFWNGDGNMQRGLTFTAPVSAGERHGMLICYYSFTDNRLVFQDAFVLPFDDRQVANNP